MSDLKCSECGARALILGDFLVCQGPQDVTDAMMASADFDLRKALSAGVDTAALDAARCMLANQKACGVSRNPDGSVPVRIAEGRSPGIDKAQMNGW